MDAMITIRPFNIENEKIKKVTYVLPETNRKVKMDTSVANKLSIFNREQKGAISSDTIYNINPEFDGILNSLETSNMIKKLATSVALAVKNGHKNLYVSKEEFGHILDLEFSKIFNNFEKVVTEKDKIIKEQANKIRMLEIKQTLFEVALNQANNEEEKNKVI